MLESVERFAHIVWHSEVNVLALVVPNKGESAIAFCLPVAPAFVVSSHNI